MIFCAILKSRCTFRFAARVQLRWCSKLLISQTPDLSSNSFTRHDLRSQARASRRAEKKFHRLGSDRAESRGMMEETGYAWGGGRGWQGRDVSRQTTRTQKPSSFGTNVRDERTRRNARNSKEERSSLGPGRSRGAEGMVPFLAVSETPGGRRGGG